MKSFKSVFFKSALIFIFFFFLILLAHLFNGQFISSDDPYYHAKHALLIEQTGKPDLLESWLEFHFLSFAPADYWWGFHLGMAFFIHWLGLFLGVKVFVSLLAASVFLIFYLILNELRVKFSFLWVLFLLFSSPIFVYRLLLERPHLLAIIFLPLAFLVLIKGRNIWLFFLSLLYTLSYVLAPLIIFQTLIYLAADAYTNRRLGLKPLIASAGGVLAGAIIHPNSLNYFYGMFTQNWLVLFLKFSGVNLGLGSEVQMKNFSHFLSFNFLVLLFYLAALVWFFASRKLKVKSTASNFLFLSAGTWFMVTLLVPRGVEYWLPAASLFAAVEFNDFFGTKEFIIAKNFLKGKINIKAASFFFLSLLSLGIFYNSAWVFYNLYQSDDGELRKSYQQANNWLIANTKKNSIIFYNNWGMWPMMFFYNDYNHYVLGMDATTTYEYDKRTYWLWRNISYDGLYCDQPEPCLKMSSAEQIRLVPDTIKNIFHAKFVIVPNHKDGNLIKTLNNLRSEARLVFENKGLRIYEIK